MSDALNPIGCREATCLAIKGSGYCLGATGSSITMIVVAAVATSIVLLLFAWDGLFIYSNAVMRPSSLIWVIPLTIGLLIFDVMITKTITKMTLSILRNLFEATKFCGNNMVSRFRQIASHSKSE